MHPHTLRFGVPVSGVRTGAPAGPQDDDSRRIGGFLVGGKFYPVMAGGDGTIAPPKPDEVIAALREKRDGVKATVDGILATAEARAEGSRDLTDEEAAAFKSGMEQYRALDDRVIDLVDLDRRSTAAAAAAKTVRVQVTSEPLTYQRGGKHSYFLDLARAETNRGDADGARSRLLSHTREMDVEMPKRQAAADAKAETEARSYAPDVSPFEKRVNPNRTDGQGGYFVPPLWLIDGFVTLARAGRPYANSVRNLTLPGGTDSINVPKILAGTTAAAQTADAAGVSSTDLTDSVSTAAVITIAGQQDIALQLIEQSPIGFDDQVIFPDLIADYNMKVDRQCLIGTNANGQAQGINGLSGTNSVTYTDGTPTAAEAYPSFAQGLSQVAGNIFMPADLIVMHPRRWYWLAAGQDTAGRPLVVPVAAGPWNAVGIFEPNAEGPAGFLLGTPVILDANVPTNQGGGTEDRVYVVRSADQLLWEGTLRARSLMEVLSGTLQVRLQVYNYLAWMPDRRPKAISVLSGTGFAAPSGF